MKLLSALLFSLFTSACLYAATPDQTTSASPVKPSATDPSGFGLKARFNELYAGEVSAITVTYAATTNINFAAAGFQSITATGNLTLTTSGLVAGRTCIVKVLASGGSRNLTLPAGWINLGAAAPTSVASGKTGVFVLRSFGTADASVVYRYEVQP